ncbi:MAG: PHP domain-containing protein, partial [Eubacteriales bacterium]
MSFPDDYHMHTFFSDGKSSAEEYIAEAISRGFSSLGFSEHSFTDFDDSFCMSRENREKYKKTLPVLKEKYRGKLKIYMGTEFDVFSDRAEERLSDYDYVIGACHYVDVGKCRRPVDASDEISCETVEKYFGGDYIAYCERYFEKISELADIPEVDIIAHFDLVTKFNE